MRYKIFFAALCMAFSIQSAALADSFDYSVTQPTETNNAVVELSGSIEGYNGDSVSVVVYKKLPDSSVWSIDYFNQMAVNADNSFGITYTLNNPTLGSSFKAIVTAGAERKQKSFGYFNDTYLNSCAQTATGYTDLQKSEFGQYIKDTSIAFGFDMDAGGEYDILSPRGKDMVIEELFVNRSDYSDVDDYRTAFDGFVDEQSIVDNINSATDKNDFISRLSQNAIALGLVATEINANSDMADKLFPPQFNLISEIKTAVTDFLILKSVNAVDFTNTTLMVSVLDKYKNELSIDSKFFTDSTFYAGFLMGIEYTSIVELKDKIIYALTQQKPVITPTPPSGGGGGGGAPSNDDNEDTAVVITPVVKEEVEPIQKEEAPVFADIDRVTWAKEAIEYLYDKKVVSGKDQYNFFPMDNVSRAEYIKMLVVAFDYEDKDAYTDKFNDLAEGSWAMPYIASAYRNKLVYGIEENIFGVSNNITREDMCVMLYRIITDKKIVIDESEPSAISDEDEIAEYAKEAVTKLRRMGIIDSVGNGRFEPKSYASRAMAAQVIYSLMIRMEVNG